jgi:hypothetical protein
LPWNFIDVPTVWKGVSEYCQYPGALLHTARKTCNQISDFAISGWCFNSGSVSFGHISRLTLNFFILDDFRTQDTNVAIADILLKQVDDATLLRFLKARNMDVAKAADMFIKDWRWRNEFAPNGYVAEESIPHQLEAEKAYLQGLDKEGRPLLICMGAKHLSKGRDLEEFKSKFFPVVGNVISRTSYSSTCDASCLPQFSLSA